MGYTANARRGVMREFDVEEVSVLCGAIAWDARACAGVSVCGGVVVGFGSFGGAVGGFLGGWGDFYAI